MSDPYCLPASGGLRREVTALEIAAPTFTPPTPVPGTADASQPQSDAHESDNVVLRNAPSLQQFTGNIFGSLRSQTALLQHRPADPKPRDPAM